MFYKSLRECCRLSWPDMRILPEDDRVWLQQLGSGFRCTWRNLQRGLQLCKIASCADLHPALHVCWDTAEAHFYHGTQLTMIVSILVWSLGGKSFNCFSVMMFCSRSFIVYYLLCQNLQFPRLALKSPPLGPKWGRWGGLQGQPAKL